MRSARILSALVASAIATGFAGGASATPIVVYSNLSADDSFGNTVHDVLNLAAYLEHAAGFVVPTGTNFLLTGIDLPVHDAISNSQLSITIWTEQAGQPGAVLETIVVDVIASSPDRYLQHITTTGSTTLQQGETYWISASAINPGRIAWFTNSTGAGRYALTSDSSHSSAWTVIDDPVAAPQGAFRILGEAVPVPEPSAAFLVALGLIAIAKQRRATLHGTRAGRPATRSS
jgi:hypothetical protein